MVDQTHLHIFCLQLFFLMIQYMEFWDFLLRCLDYLMLIVYHIFVVLYGVWVCGTYEYIRLYCNKPYLHMTQVMNLLYTHIIVLVAFCIELRVLDCLNINLCLRRFSVQSHDIYLKYIIY